MSSFTGTMIHKRAGSRLAAAVMFATLCAMPGHAAQLSGEARGAIPKDVQQLIVVDYRAMQNSQAAMDLKSRVMPPELKQLEKALARAGGIPVLAAIVFAETGLLVGFFLPGDTMLFVAGVASALAHGAYLNIYALTVTLIVAAIAGDQLGYFLGYQTGHAIFTRPDGFFFKKKHAVRAHEFYTKYGTAAIIARGHAGAADLRPVHGRGGRDALPEIPAGRFDRRHRVDHHRPLGRLHLGERAQHQLHFIVLGIALVSMLR